MENVNWLKDTVRAGYRHAGFHNLFNPKKLLHHCPSGKSGNATIVFHKLDAFKGGRVFGLLIAHFPPELFYAVV